MAKVGDRVSPTGLLPTATRQRRPLAASGALASSAAPTAGRVDIGPIVGQPPQRPVGEAPTGPTAQQTTRPSPTYQRDPRLDDLIRQLQRQTGGTPQGPLRELDLSDVEAQGGQLRDLLAQLMRGEGINVSSDVSGDPEAQAFSIARRRAAERERESAAARAAVEGGGDDLGMRAAQIAEQAGVDIAAQQAGLVGKRRDQALQTAITGANLQLGDLDRQAKLKTTEHQSYLEGERLRRAGEEAEAARQSGNTQRLLDVLMSEDARKQARFDRQSDLSLGENERLLREELLRQEVEGGRRKLGLPRSQAPIGYPSAPTYPGFQLGR